MNEYLIIQGGRVIDPANKVDQTKDVFVKKGKIVHALSELEKPLAQVIDAKGLVVCPGFVDIHVHFREPGQTHKESIKTGCEAAAAGGFTSVVCMPNTSPCMDNAGTIQYMKDVALRDASVHVFPTGTITQGRKGEQLAPIGSLKQAGVVAITDDGDCVQSNEIMRRALEYAKMFDLPVMDHCQEATLTDGAVMHEGNVSLKLGLKGWPSAAEDIIVSRNVILAAYTGAHVHMQHLSSAYSVDTIRRAKARGIPVSAEVTPHHMLLTDEALSGYSTLSKMNPPVRCEEDRQALIEGILDGTIDIIATDHAPHTDYEKDVEFDRAPFGIIGLETCLGVALEVLYHSKKADLSFIIARMTHMPSDILSLGKGTLSEGADADITLFDPTESWTYTQDIIKSRSHNTPWLERSFKGRVKKTIVSGKLVFDNGKILN